MSDGCGCLQQKQTFFGLLEIDAGIAHRHLGSQDLVRAAFDDPLVVILGMKNTARELEAAPAFYTAMTA